MLPPMKPKTPKQKNAIISGTETKPSRPSVKFTEFVVPVKTTAAKAMYKNPKGMNVCVKYGIRNAVINSFGISFMAKREAIVATINSINRRLRPDIPAEDELFNFR